MRNIQKIKKITTFIVSRNGDLDFNMGSQRRSHDWEILH